ncbi:MAG: GAF domain-containing protein [Anaerolineae bacterium]|nr:GAF domain-containing protein [Anaerolineae bacterium]
MDAAARNTAEIELAQKQRHASAALWDRIGIAAAGAVIVLGTLGVLYALMLAIRWYNQPFLGVLVSRAAVVTNTRPLGSTSWEGFDKGLKANDAILTLDGVTIDESANPGDTLNRLLAERRVGQDVTLQIYRPGTNAPIAPECPDRTATGRICTFTLTLSQFPVIDFIGQFGVGFVVALLLLVIGGVVWWLRLHQSTARLMTILCTALGLVLVGRFELTTTFQSSLLWAFAACVVSGGLINLALTYPLELAIIRRQPVLRLAPFALAMVVFAMCIYFYTRTDLVEYDGTQLIATIMMAAACLVFIAAMLNRRRRSVLPTLRDQTGLALIGAVTSLAPITLWLVLVLIERAALRLWGTDVSWLTFSSIYTLPPLLIFPLALAYALLQQRTINSDRIVSEGLIYTVLGMMLVVGYSLVTGALYALTWGVVRPDNPLLIALTIFIIALAFTPMRLRLEQAVDRAFFRQARLYEKRLEQFARTLTTSVEMDDAVRQLKQQLQETLAPQYIVTFRRNLATDDYEVLPDPETGRTQTDIHFSADSPLVELFESGTTILNIEPGHPLPPQLASERARLAVLNAPVIVRLQSGERLNGFIALGPRQDRAPYHYDDFRFIEGLADQVAAAFERSQIIFEAQRSASELKVLSQVSAALNIVMEFDTLLEFIYNQTDKVISADNFYIVLRDPRHDELYYAFYQEAGERFSDRENVRWSFGRDLISEVVRTGQPLKVDNYVQEMARRDSRQRIENEHLRAWMGVPLAGQGQALGCLAIATVDPTVTYSQDQIRVFWAIGDLAATAVYKAQLLTEAQERARQMKALNDTSSRLATEFENLDALLKTITESAVEMLRGEAGSLLLKDDASDDLIFRLAIGGGGSNLVGSRIPAGSGIAGTVVQTAKHIIVNNTRQDKRWFGEVQEEQEPQDKPFETRAILAVPLATRAGVIGVLEIINKQDGTGFGDDDVNLLTAFAGQAAIAIENARLFQMTDQALAERVQQLDNMQRIDQELNRTLDFQRVVDLTIDNAMRESGADAGMLALVHAEPPQLVVAGCIGYPADVFYVDQVLPVTFGVAGKVFRTGQIALVTALEMEADPDYAQTYPGAQSQLAVPLITGREVSAVLLLESTRADAFTMMTASFIQGLAEHANTAITNAQLVQRLKEANQARSKFVSFIAHELKNPMTSIKGYAEVLLGGVTGQMNEQQQNFIAVIQRNAVRVQQLIADLSDITQQETGNLTLKLGPISFNNVILETLRPQQRAIDEKGQTVSINVPDNLPLIWGDELRLIQVMTNLVSNAIKYTPPSGTITIQAEPTRNQWDDQGPSQVLHCWISDTGIGMDENDLKKLFSPYWRSENPRAREQPGTGLGMTLTRGLVEAHGGHIWVESTINVGTTFHITVPLASEVERTGG